MNTCPGILPISRIIAFQAGRSSGEHFLQVRARPPVAKRAFSGPVDRVHRRGGEEEDARGIELHPVDPG